MCGNMKFISSVDQDVSSLYKNGPIAWLIKIKQYTLMCFMIINNCEIIMSNHTCEIIDFISGEKFNKPLNFI